MSLRRLRRFYEGTKKVKPSQKYRLSAEDKETYEKLWEAIKKLGGSPYYEFTYRYKIQPITLEMARGYHGPNNGVSKSSLYKIRKALGDLSIWVIEEGLKYSFAGTKINPSFPDVNSFLHDQEAQALARTALRL